MLRVFEGHLTEGDWAALCASFADYSYCQSWHYGRLRAAQTGSRSHHMVVHSDDGPLALAECRVKQIPLSGAGLAYCSGGPLLKGRVRLEGDSLRKVLSALRRNYNRKGYLLRIAPRWWPGDGDGLAAAARESGFQSALVNRYRTFLVDLSRDAEELRRNMEQKWRNCLNKAERSGLSVAMGTSGALLEAFCELYRDTSERKGFRVPLDAEFFHELQASLPEREKCLTCLAYRDEAAVSGHVSSLLGNTCIYLLGASTESGRRDRAAYVLQWAVMREAQARGLRWYDLGGVDRENTPGVYHFKRGVGGEEVEFPGPFEAAGSPLKAAVVRTAEWVYGCVTRRRA